MPYHLIRLVGQNYKKLKAFDLDTKGKPPLIEITGECGAGKSSACGSLLALLKFAELPKAETEPLREGAEKGFLYGGFSEKHGGDICLEVTRTFNNKGSLTLTVTDTKKKKLPGGPQTIIDQFLSIVALRPNDIIEADKTELFDLLRKIAPMEVDVDALDAQNEADYKQRHDINQVVESLKARIPSIEFPADLPEAEVEISVISQEMEAAARANNEITERQGRREREKAKADGLREQARGLRQNAEDAKKRAIEHVKELATSESDKERSCQSRATILRSQAQKVMDEAFALDQEAQAHHESWAVHMKAVERPSHIPDPQQAIESFQIAEQREAEAASIEKRLADAPPLPEATDLSEFRQRIHEATATNALVRQKKERDKLTEELKAKRIQSEGLTLAMEKREEQKRKAISSVKMPIDGLTFGKGEVLWLGHPLAQAGTAEKWRVAISICIAQNPGLQAILVKDGSLLDRKTKAVISSMADQHGYTILMEEVDDSGKVGIYIEDGEVVKDNYANPER